MRRIESFSERLGGNPYPGRGLFIGMTPNGQNAVLAYFIMGRSDNSRNRIFVEKGDTVTILPFDESKVEDASLIIYEPVRSCGGDIVVGNGDQTATICDCLAAGKSMEEALRSRTYEPDAPHYTPRISGLLHFENEGFSYKLSILKCADEAGGPCMRAFYEYAPQAGMGHFLSTYASNGTPLPSYAGEPAALTTENDIDAQLTAIWNALNEENRISLYLRFVDLKTGEAQSRLRNKNEHTGGKK